MIYFECPECFTKSYNPNDIAHGYCGNCHRFTGEPVLSADFGILQS